MLSENIGIEVAIVIQIYALYAIRHHRKQHSRVPCNCEYLTRQTLLTMQRRVYVV